MGHPHNGQTDDGYKKKQQRIKPASLFVKKHGSPQGAFSRGRARIPDGSLGFIHGNHIEFPFRHQMQGNSAIAALFAY
jgi:hypothetical protein